MNFVTPLFDGINLLTSGNAPSYIWHMGAVTLDGANKVDLFCDARYFNYKKFFEDTDKDELEKAENTTLAEIDFAENQLKGASGF